MITEDINTSGISFEHSHQYDNKNHDGKLQKVPSSARSIVTLETAFSESTHNITTLSTITRNDASDQRWIKYYQKLKKYQSNWKKAYHRHPKLIPFVKREQRRYTFYKKYGHMKRIQLLEAFPEFKWEAPQKIQRSTQTITNTNSISLPENKTTFTTDKIQSQECVSSSPKNSHHVFTKVDQSEINTNSSSTPTVKSLNPETKNVVPSKDHEKETASTISNILHHAVVLDGKETDSICNVHNTFDSNVHKDLRNDQIQEDIYIPKLQADANQGTMNSDMNDDDIDKDYCGMDVDGIESPIFDVINFCRRSEKENRLSNNDSIDCLPMRVKNKVMELEQFYEKNRLTKTRNGTWFQSILEAKQETSPTAFVLIKWCNLQRLKIQKYFSRQRRKSFQNCCDNVIQTHETEALIQLLVAIFDKLDCSNIGKTSMLVESREFKVLNIIGQYNIQKPKPMPVSLQNIKELRQYYLQRMNKKITNEEAWYNLLLEGDSSIQREKLIKWCSLKRNAIQSYLPTNKLCPNFTYTISSLVKLYDELQNKFEAENNNLNPAHDHELRNEEKVYSVIGLPTYRIEEEEEETSCDTSFILPTKGLRIVPQSEIIHKNIGEAIKKIEQYYIENSHFKQIDKTWYESVLQFDKSKGASLLNDWCASQRGFMIDYWQRETKGLSQKPSVKSIIVQKIIVLYDKLERRYGYEEASFQNILHKEDMCKVYDIIGYPPATPPPPPQQQQPIIPEDVNKFKQNFENLMNYYIKFSRCKQKNETWFDGVLCRFKSKQVSSLRNWCSRQRKILELCNNKGCTYYKYYKTAVADIYDELSVNLPAHQREDQYLTCDQKARSILGG